MKLVEDRADENRQEKRDEEAKLAKREKKVKTYMKAQEGHRADVNAVTGDDDYEGEGEEFEKDDY